MIQQNLYLIFSWFNNVSPWNGWGTCPLKVILGITRKIPMFDQRWSPSHFHQILSGPAVWKSLLGSWAHRFQEKLWSNGHYGITIGLNLCIYSFEFWPIIKLQQILPCFVFNFCIILFFFLLFKVSRSHIALNIKQRMEECAHNDSKEAIWWHRSMFFHGEFCFADWVRGGVNQTSNHLRIICRD